VTAKVESITSSSSKKTARKPAKPHDFTFDSRPVKKTLLSNSGLIKLKINSTLVINITKVNRQQRNSTFFCDVAAEPTAETVARGDMDDFGGADIAARFGDSCIQTTNTQK